MRHVGMISMKSLNAKKIYLSVRYTVVGTDLVIRHSSEVFSTILSMSTDVRPWCILIGFMVSLFSGSSRCRRFWTSSKLKRLPKQRVLDQCPTSQPLELSASKEKCPLAL
jgi:hypothetical protein